MENPCSRGRRSFVLSSGAAALASVLPHGPSLASETAYPSRPVTIVVPFAPGGGTDIVARMLAMELSRRWASPVVVENKAGAGGQIGNAFAARAAPDGHTLLLGITTLIQAPGLYKNLPYDPFRDFTPLAQLATSVSFLALPASSPLNTVKDFVASVRARPGKVSYGSNGNAGTAHLHGALFNASQKLDMVHVPYSGSAPLLTALIGQQVDCAFVDIASLRPHVLSGKLKVIAVTGPKRSPSFPQVPTLEELGVPGFEPVGWFSLFGPAHLPEAVFQKVSGTALQAMRTPEAEKRLEELGLMPSQLSTQAFAESMKSDFPKWQKMIREGDVHVE